MQRHSRVSRKCSRAGCNRILPALSAHTYRIAFSDNGNPATSQTNQFRFTVADYLTLPAALRSPLGSEDTTKPGFNIKVYQEFHLPRSSAAQRTKLSAGLRRII